MYEKQYTRLTKNKKDFLSPRKKKKKKSYSVEALIPRNILEGKHLNQMADMTGISYQKETGIVGSILQDSKSADRAPLDIGQFVLNRKSAHKARKKNRVVQEKNLYDDFIPPKHTAFQGMRNSARRFLVRILDRDT